MKIAILGFGLEGNAAYSYWRDGNDITICDKNPEVAVPDGVQVQLGERYLEHLDQFDLIIRSPHVHPTDITKANSSDVTAKITSNTNEFLKVSPTRNIIGVTGTKGKGTTSTLIANMLEKSGKTVHLGGNIGVPALQLLEAGIQEPDWVVLELSSFQLIDLQASPHIAVCLMVVPEHLDWHPDTEEYYAAKTQLFTHQTDEDIAIFYSENETSRKISSAGSGQKLPFCSAPGAFVDNGFICIADQQICQTDELLLLGEHNWQNVCAAVTAAWQVIQNVGAIRDVLTSFKGLEHRLELVRELDGCRYYDDSFSTTPETAIVAIKAFEAPKVIILGGSDKGASYDELAKVVSENYVRKALLIGEQADRIRAALDRAGYENSVDGGETMKEIVANARAESETGDVIILSNACASFDMFKNYKDRGEQFKKAVQALV